LKFNSLKNCLNFRQGIFSAVLLVACLLLVHTQAIAGPAEDHDKASPNGGKRGAPAENESRPETGEGCQVRSSDLANFANGESYNFKSLVTYITNPACVQNGRLIASQAIAEGVSWNTTPFHLDRFGKTFSKLTLDGMKRLDDALATSIPATLRENPLSSAELMPIVGQLSLLSRKAAKSTISTLIQQELMAGDGLLFSSDGKGSVAGDIAKTLQRLGANEPAIISQMAQDLEERATLAEADSLGKILRALSAAANVEASLVPTFNLGAAAVNRGVQKANFLYDEEGRRNLMRTLFTVIEGTVGATASLEPGAQDLNEAMKVVMADGVLDESLLKRIWERAIRIVANSTSQGALAEAIAMSLTEKFVYLPKDQRDHLLASAKNYPRLASALQEKFLLSLQSSWDSLHEGKLSVPLYNERRKRFLEPMVAGLLDLEARSIEPLWLREVLKRGLVKDEDIEKRFPRLVLALMERKDRASKVASMEQGVEPTISSMTESFAVLWTLSNIHVPALNRWVQKYEEASASEESVE
jgi:hypothetical protein